MRNRAKWHIHQDYAYEDKSDIDDNCDSWTITTNPKFSGWRTDTGYEGYGLPKELAQWICNQLNKSDEISPYIREKAEWVKYEDIKLNIIANDPDEQDIANQMEKLINYFMDNKYYEKQS